MKLTPSKLEDFLSELISSQNKTSLMIWGVPGVGKSSIVAAAADSAELALVDLRLSQLAPTDLRGLPSIEKGKSIWHPPEFFPTEGKGILFLDEINMAPPTMQGIAQQLILDRQIGNYRVPDGWYIWSAGNRKQDKAAVFEMPTALANRFLHITVEPDLDSFRNWGLRNDVSEQILAFLAFRPTLLHKITTKEPAWPSPRSWQHADLLHKAGISISPAVGAAASEFQAFLSTYQSLPNLKAILNGKSKTAFPSEPSKRYAIIIGLAARTKTADQGSNGLKWVADKAGAEWLQLFVSILFPLARERGFIAALIKLASSDKDLSSTVGDLRDLIFGS